MDKVGINAPSGNVIHFKSVERAAELSEKEVGT